MTAGGARPPPAADPRYKWTAFAAVGLSFVTQVMSMSMIFVALSAIAADYGVTLRAVAWVVVAQALTISALMMPMGRLADIVGWRRVHLGGLLLFGGGAVLAALAPGFGVLILARVVMAAGNSMGQSVGTAMIVSVFPPEERGKAIGSVTTAVSIGGASGPIAGGLLLQIFPWEALFWILVAPVAVAFVAGYLILDDERLRQPRPAVRPPFDYAGAALSAAAIALLVVTINNPFAWGWTSPPILGGLAASAALIAVFASWELRCAAPMLELRMFAQRAFGMAVGARLLGFVGATVTLLLMPIYLISLRGLEEAAAGGVLFLTSLGMGVAAQGSGRLSDRFGPRPFAILGFAVMAATALALSFVTDGAPIPAVMALLLANGLALGLWNVPTNSVILGAAPASRLGVVGALATLARNLGNVMGQALASGVVVAVMAARGFDIPLDEIADAPGAAAAFADGWRVAYRLAAAWLLLALLLAAAARPPEERGAG